MNFFRGSCSFPYFGSIRPCFKQNPKPVDNFERANEQKVSNKFSQIASIKIESGSTYLKQSIPRP